MPIDEVLRLRLLIVEDELLSKVESLAREFPDCQLLRGSEIGALLAAWKSQPPKGGLAPLFPGETTIILDNSSADANRAHRRMVIAMKGQIFYQDPNAPAYILEL